MVDVARLGIELVEGVQITVCDYDGTPDEPTRLVIEGVAHFDSAREAWQVGYTVADCRWEPRQA